MPERHEPAVPDSGMMSRVPNQASSTILQSRSPCRGEGALLAALFEHDPNGILVVERGSQKVRLVNPAALGLLEAVCVPEASSFRGRPLDEVLAPAGETGRLVEVVRRAGRSGAAEEERDVELPDTRGGSRWFDIRCFPLADEQGPGELVALISDVTERMQARRRSEELARTRERERTALVELGQRLAELETPAIFPEAVEQARRLLETSAALLAIHDEERSLLRPVAAAGLSWDGRSLPPTIALDGHCVLAETFRSGQVRTTRCSESNLPELLRICRSPHEPCQVLVQPLRAAERTQGVLAVLRPGPAPFTQAEQHLLGVLAVQVAVAVENARLHARVGQERRLLQALFDNAPVGMVLWDAQGFRARRVNPALLRMTGSKPEDWLGQQRPGGLQQWDPSLYGMMEEVRDTGEPRSLPEASIRSSEGRSQTVQLTFAPIRDESGLVTYVLGLWQDVSGWVETRRCLQHALLEVEAERERLARVIEHLPVVVTLHDASGRVLLTNQAAAQLVGVPFEEWESWAPMERWRAFALSDRSGRPLAPHERPVARALKHGETIREEEFRLRRADGSERTVLISAAPLFCASGGVGGAVVLTQDVTERLRLQQELAAAKQRLEAIVEHSPIGIGFIDRELRYRLVNRALAGFHGLPAEEHLGRSVMEIVPGCPKARAAFKRVLETGEPWYGPQISCREWQSRCEQEHFHTIHALPILDAESRTEGLLLLLIDQTAEVFHRHALEQALFELERQEQAAEQGRREVERLNVELRGANAAKDQFLAVLSHELRNPLAPIVAGVEILRRSLPESARSPAIERTVQIVERNARLQARLVNDLLDLSRIRRGKLQLHRVPVALDDVVAAAVQAQQDDAEQAGIRLFSELQRNLWVLGDADRLQQVVTNLLSNALKFTGSGGEVRVRLRQLDGPHCAIEVQDTGIGIPAELLPRLFDMFQQGEVAGRRKQGLGIGLALVRSITAGHGGSVQAESEGPGRGSLFRVVLPMIARPVRGALGLAPERMAEGVNLLLVEDNDDTRLLLENGLTLMGYRVHAAATAEEALELGERVRPQVILSDIGLPGMDGYEFLRRARKMPTLSPAEAFAITGLGQEEDVRRAIDAGYQAHFVKPVDMALLDREIRERLRRRT